LRRGRAFSQVQAAGPAPVIDDDGSDLRAGQASVFRDAGPGTYRALGAYPGALLHDWEDLFAESFTLDIAIMYGATWRNTYRKNLSALAQRPDGRIRIILPEPAPDSMLIETYAHSLRITPEDLRRKINEAISDFDSLEPRRHIEVYLTSALFRHAIYVFTHRAVIALYSLCGERIATPALLASEGGLLNFVRLDFDRLLEQSKRIS
jgi:hypothetical protein